jgi:hypothetical protein
VVRVVHHGKVVGVTTGTVVCGRVGTVAAVVGVVVAGRSTAAGVGAMPTEGGVVTWAVGVDGRVVGGWVTGGAVLGVVEAGDAAGAVVAGGRS